MNINKRYMHRCLQLARNGKGYVSPNPMVGAVIVYEDRIIGEGFHRAYGKAHAEVNAINSVKDKSLLEKSTIYVSLEPCSHYGKTPPCAQLIIDSKIPKVVVAMLDPYEKVSGRGIEMLRQAGIDVTAGVLENEAKELNKAFLTSQTKGRPYIYLKWAQTRDGFIDKLRVIGDIPQPARISNDIAQLNVHKLRSEVSSILIGTNTAINDNPSLTTRYWYGKNPIRIVLDRRVRIPSDYKIYDNSVETIIFTEEVKGEVVVGKTKYIPLSFDDGMFPQLMKVLNRLQINSLLVEGGLNILQSFIDHSLWDEAFIEIAQKEFGAGLPAPIIKGDRLNIVELGNHQQIHFIRN